MTSFGGKIAMILGRYTASIVSVVLRLLLFKSFDVSHRPTFASLVCPSRARLKVLFVLVIRIAFRSCAIGPAVTNISSVFARTGRSMITLGQA